MVKVPLVVMAVEVVKVEEPEVTVVGAKERVRTPVETCSEKETDATAFCVGLESAELLSG